MEVVIRKNTKHRRRQENKNEILPKKGCTVPPSKPEIEIEIEIEIVY